MSIETSKFKFTKEVFIDNYPYVFEFLEQIVNYRYEHDSKVVDTKFIQETKNDIISKYRKCSKIKINKH